MPAVVQRSATAAFRHRFKRQGSYALSLVVEHNVSRRRDVGSRVGCYRWQTRYLIPVFSLSLMGCI
jgi:hypothetical protein